MRMGVRGKLLGSSAILIAFVLLIGLLGFLNLSSAHDTSVKLTDKVVAPLEQLGVARAKFNENRAYLNNYMLESDQATADELVGKIDANDQVIAENMTKVEATLLTAEGKAAYADLQTALAAYAAARTKVIDTDKTQGAEAAYALNKAEAVPAAKTAAEDFQKLFDMKVAIAEDLGAEVTSSFESARNITIVAIILAVAIGFTLSFWLARKIVGGVRQVQDTAQMLSEKCATWLADGMTKLRDGDLTYEVTPVTPLIEHYGSDEIGKTAEFINGLRNKIVAAIEAYNEARAGLTDTIADVQEAADSVSRTSEQLNEAPPRSRSRRRSARSPVAPPSRRAPRATRTPPSRSSPRSSRPSARAPTTPRPPSPGRSTRSARCRRR